MSSTVYDAPTGRHENRRRKLWEQGEVPVGYATAFDRALKKHGRGPLRKGRDPKQPDWVKKAFPIVKSVKTGRAVEAPKVCARRKADRRNAILQSGYGGINDAKNYRRHKKC